MAGKQDSTVLNIYANHGADPSRNKQDPPGNNPSGKRERKPTSYMQINVFDYEDYLYRMSRLNHMTTTGYVLSLIAKDAAVHAKEYESIRNLPQFDKPHRESPNRKNK